MNYYLNQNDQMTIEDYDRKKAFTSFLPGIAGLKGIPLWSFYVNRGQGVCSFGVEDKHSPIMEFFPANQSYQYVETYGFRTFIEVDGEIYEPFKTSRDENIARKMMIGASEFTIEETNTQLGISTSVTYFGLPSENFGALVRDVKVKNLGGGRSIKVLDGIANILPYGIKNEAYKEMGNLFRSWMEVVNIESGLPFFKMRTSTEDTVEVELVTKGHFFLSFTEDGKLIKPIVDRKLVFGENTSLNYPDRFSEIDFEQHKYKQYTTNKVPCGFSPVMKAMAAEEVLNIHTLIGHAAGLEVIEEQLDKLLSGEYINQKRAEASDIVQDMLKNIETKTGKPMFDAYLKQSYLDNLLRGGYPIKLKGNEKIFNYYVYSRKHGDPEREYNFFKFAPEFYSNGEGNFRDVNQNRRCDVLFNPSIGAHNIKVFMNLMQLDGYNPLVVENSRFVLKADMVLVERHLNTNVEAVKLILKDGYTPGHLMAYLHEHTIDYKTNEEAFIAEVLDASLQTEGARHGEGYWSDHFTYNLDLIEAYLKVYPDQLKTLLVEDKTYKYFDSPERVVTRGDKYVLTDEGVRQYGAVVKDQEKIERESMDEQATNWVKDRDGHVFMTNLLVKLLSLSAVKLSMLDPSGMGIEMDAGKPGWNDALNGLSGLIGSGLSETIETKRIFEFLQKAFREMEDLDVELPKEINTLINELMNLLGQGQLDEFTYWNHSATLRENYRENTRFGVSGQLEVVDSKTLIDFVGKALVKLEHGIDKAISLGDGIPPSFFTYEATDYEVVKQDGQVVLSPYGLPAVTVKAFDCKVLPLFLEAPARYFKTGLNVKTAKKIHQAVTSSNIYDHQLKMYKTSESLDCEGHDIGRIRAFTPGWLERESVFLHMTYKYLLGLLKAGLYKEFYEAMNTNFVPFMDPEVYGRSILENSSFLASSVNPDPEVHGRGFVSRLSGSNAEVLEIWYQMMIGEGGFKYNQEKDKLSFEFSPILKGTFFDAKGEISFRYLSHTEIQYINPTNRDTYGEASVEPNTIVVEIGNEKKHIKGNALHNKMAHKLRNQEIDKISVYFA